LESKFPEDEHDHPLPSPSDIVQGMIWEHISNWFFLEISDSATWGFIGAWW